MPIIYVHGTQQAIGPGDFTLDKGGDAGLLMSFEENAANPKEVGAVGAMKRLSAGSLSGGLGEIVQRFIWSGDANQNRRMRAAAALAQCLADGDCVVTHSHGGNVLGEALGMSAARGVKVFLFACPVMSQVWSAASFVDHTVFEFASPADLVQTGGAQLRNFLDLSKDGGTCLGVRFHSANDPERQKMINPRGPDGTGGGHMAMNCPEAYLDALGAIGGTI